LARDQARPLSASQHLLHRSRSVGPAAADYDSHHQLRQHIQTFLDAYNFAKRLKTLNGLTPFG
jgi:hypothetical protein